VLRYTWDFVDDNGQDLRTSTFQYHPDPACNLRMAAARETFHLSGSLKVFHQTTDGRPAHRLLALLRYAVHRLPLLPASDIHVPMRTVVSPQAVIAAVLLLCRRRARLLRHERILDGRILDKQTHEPIAAPTS